MTKCGVILAIMDMASAKSDVNGPKKKVWFKRIFMKSDKKNYFKTYRPKLYRIKLEFQSI